MWCRRRLAKGERCRQTLDLRGVGSRERMLIGRVQRPWLCVAHGPNRSASGRAFQSTPLPRRCKTTRRRDASDRVPPREGVSREPPWRRALRGTRVRAGPGPCKVPANPPTEAEVRGGFGVRSISPCSCIALRTTIIACGVTRHARASDAPVTPGCASSSARATYWAMLSPAGLTAALLAGSRLCSARLSTLPPLVSAVGRGCRTRGDLRDQPKVGDSDLLWQRDTHPGTCARAASSSEPTAGPDAPSSSMARGRS